MTNKGLARVKVETHPRDGLELWGALPGEQIQIQLGHRRNLWLQQIDSVHPQRRESRCLHAGPCGGCAWQHWSDEAQLQAKSERVYRALAGVAPELTPEPPRASPQPFHYRTKVEFSFLGSQLGYHRRGCFDRAVDVDFCWIAPPAHFGAVTRTRAWMRDHGLSGWNPRSAQGDLRYLLVRQANPGSDWLTVLVTRPGLDPELLQDWSARLEPLGPRGLVWVEQESPAGAIVPLHEHLLFGANEVRQPLGHLHFSLGWRSFFQTNPPAYQQLLDTLRLWLQPLAPASLLDLYCGIGSIGLYVTDAPTRLVGVENVPEAVADAARCAVGREAEFHACPAEAWGDWNHPVAIVDPPRSGCHPELVRRLAQHGPRDVFYISCNPDRLVAEMAVLGEHYRVERAAAFDFFPQTAHLELLCWLRRKGA